MTTLAFDFLNKITWGIILLKNVSYMFKCLNKMGGGGYNW